jgi:hypothetical protein
VNADCDGAPSTDGPPQATRTPSQRNPYLFVVGAARSGTTLMQRLLDAHPMLAVVNETYWVLRALWEPTGLTRDRLVTRALVEQLMASPKFDRMGLSVDDLTRLMPSDVAITYDRDPTRQTTGRRQVARVRATNGAAPRAAPVRSLRAHHP